MNELYEDVLKEEPEMDSDEKAYKKWQKRLYKSVGWVEPMEQGKVFVNKKGNADGTPFHKRIVWDVNMGRGCSFTCKKQVDSEILSLLAQMNERLKRLENR